MERSVRQTRSNLAKWQVQPLLHDTMPWNGGRKWRRPIQVKANLGWCQVLYLMLSGRGLKWRRPIQVKFGLVLTLPRPLLCMKLDFHDLWPQHFVFLLNIETYSGPHKSGAHTFTSKSIVLICHVYSVRLRAFLSSKLHQMRFRWFVWDSFFPKRETKYFYFFSLVK